MDRAQPPLPYRRVRLRPQDPFDLIRLLARSQTDPRKALAELVQNSLDAGAKRIEIRWFNERGRRAISIRDDGEGVFPDLDREAALQRIARTIGQSHKRDLSPAQRRELLVQGQYGIGLIGFWSVGEALEMKSRVGGGQAFVLRLMEDRSEGEVFPSRSRHLDEEDTFTEIVIRGIHEAAVSKVRPPRLQAYLASELRGQLLERGARVEIKDAVARGKARKRFTVEPRPYLGRPLDAWRELPVPGFESARVELYLVQSEEEHRGVVSLACGGTVVLDDIAEIDGIDQPREPWCSGALEGVIDFPELHVSPGTRRGFAHDEPVEAFLEALPALERAISERLAEERRRHAELRQESLARDIRRAFLGVARKLPEYDFFGVRGRGTDAGEAGRAAPSGGSGGPAPSTGGEAMERAPGAEEACAVAEPEVPAPELRDDLLFPPGPLQRIEVQPRSLRVAPLATRGLHARGLDADGRPCAGEVTWSWRLEGPGDLETAASRASYTAPDIDPEQAPSIALFVRGRQEGIELEIQVLVRLVVPAGVGARLAGIPDPTPVSAPGEAWRSRMRGGSWEYNTGHRDFLEVADHDARRLRYLIHLFAKEVVVQNFGGPGSSETLERMVELLTHLDGARR